MKKYSPHIYIALALPIQMVMVRLLASSPNLIERWYSNGLYPFLSKGFRYALGWIPFSFGDLMYTILVVLIIRALIIQFKTRFRYFKSFLVQTVSIFSIIYFAFHLLWGMNYYRLPLHEALSIDREYTTEELLALTNKLIKQSNTLHEQLAENDSMRVIFKEDQSAVFEQTLNGYQKLKDKFPKLDYPPKSIKNSLLTYPLSVMGYSGYLNPITNEAQINGMVPPHRWPVISCHEEAHQLGFAKENEANFIAVMATLANEDPYFQYSGSIFALRYCLSDLYRRDNILGETIKESIRPGIFVNYQDSRDFWEEMDNPLEPFFDLFYSNYLIANNQPDGLKSYSYMVALLVNYDKRFPSTF